MINKSRNSGTYAHKLVYRGQFEESSYTGMVNLLRFFSNQYSWVSISDKHWELCPFNWHKEHLIKICSLQY